MKRAKKEVGKDADLADLLHYYLSTPNEFDANGEEPNLVDGLYAIARALTFLGKSILVVNSMDVGDVEAKLGLAIPRENVPVPWVKKKIHT